MPKAPRAVLGLSRTCTDGHGRKSLGYGDSGGLPPGHRLSPLGCLVVKPIDSSLPFFQRSGSPFFPSSRHPARARSLHVRTFALPGRLETSRPRAVFTELSTPRSRTSRSSVALQTVWPRSARRCNDFYGGVFSGSVPRPHVFRPLQRALLCPRLQPVGDRGACVCKARFSAASRPGFSHLQGLALTSMAEALSRSPAQAGCARRRRSRFPPAEAGGKEERAESALKASARLQPGERTSWALHSIMR